jgi:hypothetical protein
MVKKFTAELEKLIARILSPLVDEKKEKKKNKKDIDEVDDSFSEEKIDFGKLLFFEDKNKKKVEDINDTGYEIFMNSSEFSPESYKLNFRNGDEVFQGYYKSVMDDLRKVNAESYSSFGRKIEAETLNDALIVIKDKKENSIKSMDLDVYAKMKVDAMKWSNIYWWYILYDLEGKVIF